MQRISVTLPSELIEWLQDQVRTGRFASISHGVRYAVAKLREKEGEGK